MQVFRDPLAFQRACLDARRAGALGFVPTMGALHAGHESLLRLASAHRTSALSIFVNPSQFGANEDLSRYPRPLDADLEKARACGVQLVLVPEPADVYPSGFQTWVEPGPLAGELEGAHRPGHFRGVATVVLKLLNLAQPTHAFFGSKDYQQLAVVKRLVRDLALPTEIVGAPTLREPDGLAMSSRNVFLSPEERRRALSLHAALEATQTAVLAGERDSAKLEAQARERLAPHVDALDYVAVRDAETLDRLERAEPGRAVMLVAAKVGRTRLIDNQRLG